MGQLETLGRFILYRRRDIGHHIGPGPQATLTGRLRILSPEHLSASRQLAYSSTPCDHPAPLLSAEIRRLGELTVVFEPSHQPYLCSVCNAGAPMGTSICHNHSANTMQSTKASTDPCIFRRRH